MKTLGRWFLASTLLLTLTACSDDDGGSGGTEACGLICTGSAVCTSSLGTDTGSANVRNGSCVLTAQASHSSLTLKCDGSATLKSPEGTAQGTWSGEGTHATISSSAGTYSCTITPPEDYGNGGSGGSTDPCASCLQNACNSELTSCNASASCVSLANCIGKCSTEACVNACAEQDPGGIELLLDFLDCADKKCGSACA